MFGTNNGIVSDFQASKAKRDNGTITYSATVANQDAKEYGISINSKNGKLSISNYETLAEKLVDHDGNLTVKVSAHKTAENMDQKRVALLDRKEFYK